MTEGLFQNYLGSRNNSTTGYNSQKTDLVKSELRYTFRRHSTNWVKIILTLYTANVSEIHAVVSEIETFKLFGNQEVVLENKILQLTIETRV